MTEREPPAPPSLLASLLDVAGGARAAWSPRLVFLSSVFVLAAWTLEPALSPLVHGRGGAGSWILAALTAAVLTALAVLVYGIIALGAGWEFGRDCRWGLGESVRMIRARAANLFLSLVSIPLAVALLAAIIVGGAFVAGLLAHALAVAWLALVGLPLALLAATLLFLGVPAMLLMIPAAALDSRESFDTVSRTVSYVRARPLRFALLVLAAALAAALAALVFALFAATVADLLLVGYRLASGDGTALPSALRSLLRGGAAWADIDLGFLALRLRWPALGAGALPSVLARLVEASFLAGVAAGFSRVYLHMRWEVDGDPPSALVHADETFEWER